MATLIAGTVAVLVLYTLLQMFRSANPAVMARGVKIAGGLLALAVAGFIGLRGELAIAIPLGVFGAGLLGWSPFGTSGFGNIGGLFGSSSRSSGQTSHVRSQYLDMTLDHDSGALTGRIVAGPGAGRSLDQFDLPQLTSMMTQFDAESIALLESYLDRRFPAWRHHAEADAAGRQGGGRASRGKMTDEEAYQILGLQPGAGRDEISRAHRSLMKKLHPDQGGSTYLAARVNEAKDTLLRTHRS